MPFVTFPRLLRGTTLAAAALLGDIAGSPVHSIALRP
jgi:hypothetical protein